MENIFRIINSPMLCRYTISQFYYNSFHRLIADRHVTQWARKVDDETWAWKNVKERFKKIENYHVDIPQEGRRYISPNEAGKLCSK